MSLTGITALPFSSNGTTVSAPSMITETLPVAPGILTVTFAVSPALISSGTVISAFEDCLSTVILWETTFESCVSSPGYTTTMLWSPAVI